MDKEEAIEFLREILKPGDVVYCILRHVSKSGMTRHISFLSKDLRGITHFVGLATGYKVSPKDGGLVVGGCGMDMGFHVVYSLGRILFPGGFGIEGTMLDGRKFRPSTKSEAEGSNATFFGRNGDTSGWDNDGGYALRREWL